MLFFSTNQQIDFLFPNTVLLLFFSFSIWLDYYLQYNLIINKKTLVNAI